MRVLQISSARDWAGGEVHTFLLCKELSNSGCKVTLACRPNSVLSKIFYKEGLNFFCIPLFNSVDILSAFLLALYCWIKKIDIIHVQIARDTWLAYGAKILCPRVKIVFTRHVLYPLKYSKCHKYLYNNIDKVIAVSHAVKDVIVGQNIIPESKISVIYNGIDLEKFKYASGNKIIQELNFSEKQRLVGVIGRITPEKGQDIFIKSIPLILKDHPDTKFLIVGSDTEKYTEKLNLLANELGIPDKVVFLGVRSDIPDIMKMLDVFVLSSLSEPFGLVLVEAMAAGIPVVATQAGGAREIIVNNESGILVEPSNHEDLAAAVSNILRDNELAKKLNTAGKERAKIFEADMMSSKTYELYKELLC